ncbi:hypothetical protein ACVFI8_20970 [Agarivorans sp. MS3-6]|uniref:hypothetical protein n=1 Tax=Agarivorans sp. TSD2052 TaxID=2937286 RepID=UPI00200D19EA|nr:hypothetical protein [Agarivorans sp. TSD2052]UPW16695.1 hypothetical protein M0C34_10585 [Agarivorans sp. TSD2052]
MEQIKQQFDQLLSPLEQLTSLCDRLPCGDKKNALMKSIQLVKDQNEQAKQEAYALLSQTQS